MMKIKLRECPFCGYEKIILCRKNRTVIKNETTRNTYCYCPKCDCRGKRILYRDFDNDTDAEYEAAYSWNRRFGDGCY